MPAAAGGGPALLHSDRGRGERARMLPFCQEMPDAAAGLGGPVQLCKFPGPHGPLGSLRRGRDGVAATPDPTRDSFLPGPWCQRRVGVHTCKRGKADVTLTVFGRVALKEGPIIVKRDILLVALSGKRAVSSFLIAEL